MDFRPILFLSLLYMGRCCQPPPPAFQQVPPAPSAPLLPQVPQFQASPANTLVSGVQSGVASLSSHNVPSISNSIDQELTPFMQGDSSPKQTFNPYPGYIPPPPVYPTSAGEGSFPARENGLQNVAIDDDEVRPSIAGCPQLVSNVDHILSCLQILPAVPMDEHALQCSFEQGTKCRFQPTSPAFQLTRLPTLDHYKALAKLANRGESNYPLGDFLSLVEPKSALNEEFVISTPITCQNGTGILSFDFWVVGNPTAVIQVCTQDFKARSCTKEILHGIHSFVTVQVVHPNAAVFDVEVMITNITRPTVLVIDNLDYKAELCDNKNRDETSIGATPSPDVVESFFEEDEQDDDNSAAVPTRPEDPSSPIDGSNDDTGHSPSRDGPPAMSPFDLEIRQSPLTINKLNPCEQMACDFNVDFCSYKNWKNSSRNTHDWQWASSRVGNPHTGVREKNNDGGFLYVGTDEDDNSILTYVLESPLVQLNEDAELVFDIYRRSKDITLQICLNSPHYCPLDVPAFKKETDWIPGIRFPIPQSTTKIYLKAIQWRKFKWLAIDNIRIDGPRECSS